MFALLRSHIEKRVPLTDEEFQLTSGFFLPKTVMARQFFLQEGDVSGKMAFVNSGCLRKYTIDQKGKEHIIQFAVKDWWMTDLNSFLSGTPSTLNIDALQDSELLLLEKSSREKLLEALPKMERFFRLLLESNYIATHNRISDSLSASAEERYLTFIRTYPRMMEEIPQHQIASYLGITPQSLSRIRKELSRE